MKNLRFDMTSLKRAIHPASLRIIGRNERHVLLEVSGSEEAIQIARQQILMDQQAALERRKNVILVREDDLQSGDQWILRIGLRLVEQLQFQGYRQ